MRPREFWATEGHKYLTPASETNPEGFHVKRLLREWTRDQFVLDFGCGDGRLCRAFDPERYFGCDLNRTAIERARRRHSEYRFAQHACAGADIVLCYTVLLHVPDDELDRVIASLCMLAPRVLVCEILGYERSDWAFNRERKDYARRFASHGRFLRRIRDYPYKRYPGTDISFMEFA